MHVMHVCVCACVCVRACACVCVRVCMRTTGEYSHFTVSTPNFELHTAITHVIAVLKCYNYAVSSEIMCDCFHNTKIM